MFMVSKLFVRPMRARMAVLPAVLLLAIAGGASAQTAATTVPPEIRSTLSAVPLHDLPSSGSIGGILETIVPEIISDQIEAGGLGVGRGGRLGARGSPWSQTAFQFDDVDLTDAGATGRSLLFLDPLMFQSVDVSTALMPIEQSAPGVSIRAVPVRPSASWQGRVGALLAVPSRAAPVEQPPPIDALRTWQHVDALVSGPVVRDRLRIAAGGVIDDGTHFERADPTILSNTERNAFVTALFTPSAVTEVSAAVVGSVSHLPSADRRFSGQLEARERLSNLIIESTWIHRTPSIAWTASAAYGRSSLQPETGTPPVLRIDSVLDGPVMTALAVAGVHGRWSTVLRMNGTAGNRWLQGLRAGVEFDGASASEDPTQMSLVEETVEGVPARVWRFATPTTASRRHATTAVLYAAERVTVGSRLAIEAGARWEGTGADAAHGDSLAWHDWFPRATLRWEAIQARHVSLFAGIARYGYRPTLESLAYGDPAAPSADVFRWTDRNGDGQSDPAEIGPLVARTAGAPAISSIDPNLRRPYLDEFVTGVEVHPSDTWLVRLTGMTRAERRMIAAVNTGAPVSAYTVSAVPDAGEDVLDPSDDRALPLYSRNPDTFGADRYLLTNPDDFTTTGAGVEITVQHAGDRLWLLAGASACRSSGPAMARGFLASENDRGIPGDLYLDPNAFTYARGSFFADRSYTIKVAGVYRWPHDVRLGVGARYQDGQPFSRLVLAPDLAQGAEVVRAYRTGRTRFTYTATLDSRLQKGFAVGKQRVTLVLDIFNLLNMANEVEEDVLTGPGFRRTTAVQPPRTAHVGVEFSF
jgi:hypothetical protein